MYRIMVYMSITVGVLLFAPSLKSMYEQQQLSIIPSQRQSSAYISCAEVEMVKVKNDKDFKDEALVDFFYKANMGLKHTAWNHDGTLAVCVLDNHGEGHRLYLYEIVITKHLTFKIIKKFSFMPPATWESYVVTGANVSQNALLVTINHYPDWPCAYKIDKYFMVYPFDENEFGQHYSLIKIPKFKDVYCRAITRNELIFASKDLKELWVYDLSGALKEYSLTDLDKAYVPLAEEETPQEVTLSEVKHLRPCPVKERLIRTGKETLQKFIKLLVTTPRYPGKGQPY